MHRAGSSVNMVCLWESIFWSLHKWSIHLTLKQHCRVIFYIRETEQCWNCSSSLRDATDIYRFPTVHMVKTHFLLENLWISKLSLSILENFQRSSTLPNIKIFLVSNVLIICVCFKIYFLIDTFFKWQPSVQITHLFWNKQNALTPFSFGI